MATVKREPSSMEMLLALFQQRDAYEMTLKIIANGSETGDPVALAKEVLSQWQ